MTKATMDKYSKLQGILQEMGSILVAFSGGVDSTLLLAAALQALGSPQILAVTLASEIQTEQEIEEAKEAAAQLAAPHLVIPIDDLSRSEFARNDPQRCYYCKKMRCELLLSLAREKKLAWVAEGSNTDDLLDYRPGGRAARELGIRSPLLEADLAKNDIRSISRDMGLSVWDKPAKPCLATRIPFGTSITEEILSAIKQGEALVAALIGTKEIRLRHHGNIARLEIPPASFHAAIAPDTAQKICAGLKRLGYTYTALDLRGYRQGSMNEEITAKGD